MLCVLIFAAVTYAARVAGEGRPTPRGKLRVLRGDIPSGATWSQVVGCHSPANVSYLWAAKPTSSTETPRPPGYVRAVRLHMRRSKI